MNPSESRISEVDSCTRDLLLERTSSSWQCQNLSLFGLSMEILQPLMEAFFLNEIPSSQSNSISSFEASRRYLDRGNPDRLGIDLVGECLWSCGGREWSSTARSGNLPCHIQFARSIHSWPYRLDWSIRCFFNGTLQLRQNSSQTIVRAWLQAGHLIAVLPQGRWSIWKSDVSGRWERRAIPIHAKRKIGDRDTYGKEHSD